jgi:hypothetical protein
MYYAGLYEISAGRILVVSARSSDTNANAVSVGAQIFDEWLFDDAMPGVITPSTANMTVSTTQQLAVKGAGPFTYAVSGTSGGTIGATGLYTAGPANGSDTVTVTDVNSKTAGTFVSTVTGAVSLDPTLQPGANLVLRADHSTNTGNGTVVTAWNDELGNHNMSQPTGGAQFTYNTVGINSKPDVTGASGVGMWTDTGNLGTTAISLTACVSWTSTTTDMFIFGARYNNYHYDIGNDTVNPGQFVFRVNTSIEGIVVIKSDSTALNDGNRHTITGSWDGATIKMYVDGVLQANTAVATGTLVTPASNSDANSIGAAINSAHAAPSNSFIGKIKGANSSNQACSASDAAKLNTWYAGL